MFLPNDSASLRLAAVERGWRGSAAKLARQPPDIAPAYGLRAENGGVFHSAAGRPESGDSYHVIHALAVRASAAPSSAYVAQQVVRGAPFLPTRPRSVGAPLGAQHADGHQR